MFTWTETEDKDIYENGKTVLWITGTRKAIQNFVEVLSNEIGHKCDFSYIGGRAHIDVMADGYEKAKVKVFDKKFMGKFVNKNIDDENYFEVLN